MSGYRNRGKTCRKSIQICKSDGKDLGKNIIKYPRTIQNSVRNHIKNLRENMVMEPKFDDFWVPGNLALGMGVLESSIGSGMSLPLIHWGLKLFTWEVDRDQRGNRWDLHYLGGFASPNRCSIHIEMSARKKKKKRELKSLNFHPRNSIPCVDLAKTGVIPRIGWSPQPSH